MDGEDHIGRFSEGGEVLPDSPEKDQVGRFSEGEEVLPDSPEKDPLGGRRIIVGVGHPAVGRSGGHRSRARCDVNGLPA
jgi:hypothetical protein